MKRLLLLTAVVSTIGAFGQDVLPASPDEVIDLRLDRAGEQMGKAAWSRETSIYWALGGGLFAMLAADQSAKAYDHGLAVGLGAITIGGFAFLQIKGAKHDRRAAQLLRHTE
ncbi:MAG: hypothetical protein KDC00_12400 [Flavobacteriales bacterium]|nr:hypothetical protein [Flavobacteriales bacterium]